jgi:hypothetical protein
VRVRAVVGWGPYQHFLRDERVWQDVEAERVRYCEHCGEPFYFGWKGNGLHIRYCCGECRWDADGERRHARRARPRLPRPCMRCGETFTPARSDARYCSGRCRVAAHRARVQGAAT